MIEKNNCKSTGTLVDALGETKARIADLKVAEDEIKNALLARLGADAKAQGERFRVSISNSLRSTTDWKAVALALAKKAAIGDDAFENLVAANTNLTETWHVRCAARMETCVANHRQEV